MAGLKPYEITNENGFATTLLLSEHDAKRRGLTEADQQEAPKPARRRRSAPKPANKQAPAPQDKAPADAEADADGKADGTGFEAFETTAD